MILAGDGLIITEGGQVKAGDCPTCCGVPGNCGCPNGSPWYRTDCSGASVFSMQAAFTINLPYAIVDQYKYFKTVPGNFTCDEGSFGPFGPALLPDPTLTGSLSTTLTQFNRLQDGTDDCSLGRDYRKVAGVWPESILGRLFQGSTYAPQRATAYDAADGLAVAQLAAADAVSDTTGRLRVSVGGAGEGGVLVQASWELIVRRLRYEPDVVSVPFQEWRITAQYDVIRLFNQTRIISAAELCNEDSFTLTDPNGSTCVISKYAGDLPTRYTASARCYDVALRSERVRYQAGAACYIHDGYETATVRVAKALTAAGTAWYRVITPGFRGGLTPTLSGWMTGITRDADGVEFGGLVYKGSDGESPTGTAETLTRWGITSISAASCSEGVDGPCTAFEDCYQFGEGATQTITSGGRLFLYFNDNNFTDNESATMTVAVYVDAVLTWTVNVPNGSSGGVEVGPVSAGQDITTVRTAGYFNIGTDPAGRLDADGQYIVGGGSPGTTPAADDFVCAGLLTYTLVGKVISP